MIASILLSLSFSVSCVVTAFAESLTKVITRDQPPISKTFPSQADARLPRGTGKLVIFTREAVGKSNEWDLVAGAWECVPSRPDLPVTKRIEFCHTWCLRATFLVTSAHARLRKPVL